MSDHVHPLTNTQGQSPFGWNVLGAIATAIGGEHDDRERRPVSSTNATIEERIRQALTALPHWRAFAALSTGVYHCSHGGYITADQP